MMTLSHSAAHRRLLTVVTILSSLWLFIAPAAAQTTLGTIRGTVFDPQQSIVPGATIVVTDEATNVTREAQTDAQGLFEMPRTCGPAPTPSRRR